MLRLIVLVAMSLILTAAALAVRAQNMPETPGMATAGPHGELRMLGQTEPVARVEVPATMKGVLASIDVREGQIVKNGQVLARLDDAMEKKQVELAELDAASELKIKQAQNNLDFARNDYDRIKQVASASPAEIRQKELLVRQYELEVQRTQEEQKEKQVKLEQERITLDHMTIRSPIDGAVLRINKQAGEQTDDNPLIVVVQVSRLHAVFYPPKELFGKIREGDKVMLEFATEPVTRREAVVVAVDPLIEQSLFRVKFRVDNTDAKIPAGTAAVWQR